MSTEPPVPINAGQNQQNASESKAVASARLELKNDRVQLTPRQPCLRIERATKVRVVVIVVFFTLRVPCTQNGLLSRVKCFWSCSCSQKKMKFWTKSGIHCISRSSIGAFILCAGTHWSN